VIVLKLGGSVITRKDEPETIDEAQLDRVAEAVAGADERVALVHGAGSFGHYYADRHGVSETEGTRDPEALLDIHYAMQQLNSRVVGALRGYGVGAVPVHSFSLCHRTEDGDLAFPAGGVGTMLAEGFTPVLHGDVVAHRDRGVTILSGDEVVVELARSFSPDRVGLCSTVPGVMRDDEVIDRIADFSEVEDVLGGAEGTDVTGGMAGKVRRLLSLSAPASVFGPEDLAAFVDGHAVGTVIDGRE
jgi:isopentenyl phosphate kinase